MAEQQTENGHGSEGTGNPFEGFGPVVAAFFLVLAALLGLFMSAYAADGHFQYIGFAIFVLAVLGGFRLAGKVNLD